jgi:hypothetical protein
MAIDPEHSPVSGLAAQIDTLLTKLDCLTGELETSLEKAVVSASNGEQTSEQLRSANAEYEQRIADMESAHQARLRELEDRYEQRVDSLQKRQAELQEELVRLRTDLGEEVSIRQHVAGELEDKTREWEEQHEFLVVLQADITQEKDRATDLGVRLQEALLDVDGMRSAEQTLVIQVREMQEDRTRLITDLGEAQLAAQNCGSELAGTKAELEITAAQLVQAQLDRDQALRNQSAEADRVMRDRIAEADGDRAVLEHQNLTLTKEIDELRRDATEKLEHAKNDAVRREDGLKAELSFTKAQLREVQRRETMLSDELAMAKDTSAALVQKETHSTNLTRDAVVLAGKYHDACQRLMTAISASTTISGSLSLPVRAKSPPTAAPTASELKDNSVLVRSLETASAFELDAFGDAVLRTINLARKLSKSCKQYRESGRGKITISSFGRGDLVLFLPTRNAAVKAWAAFNISAPHHFLHVTDDIQRQLVGKDYYLARITSTDEAVVNGDSPETNPYGLAEGLRYYSHHVEEWSPGLPSRSARRAASGPGPSGIPPLAEPTPSRARATSSFYPAPPRLERQGSAQSAPPPSPPNRLSPTATPQIQRGMSAQGSSPAPRAPSPLTMSRTHSPVQLPAGAGSGRTPASPIPRRLSARSPPTQPLRSILAKSPPPPPTSPTSPVAVLERPREYTHRHRPSLSSTASPPIDGFAPSSGGRPASVASSASSHPRGLSIPTPTAKAAPAAPVATSSTTGSPSSFDSRRAGVAMGGIPRKASLASLKGKGDDLFKPSPLGGNSSSADPEGSGAGTAPGTSLGAASGFLSGLSLTRKRQSGGSNLAPSAVDMLKRIDGSG